MILNHPTFRVWYNEVMAELINGPLAVSEVQGFLDDAQALLTEALLADPNNRIGNSSEAIAEHFDSLRAWVVARRQSVNVQLSANGPPPPRD